MPSQASKIVKAKIESIDRKGEHCIFEPEFDVVAASGLSIPEKVLTIIAEKGRVNTRVKLHGGAEHGVIEAFVATPKRP